MLGMLGGSILVIVVILLMLHIYRVSISVIEDYVGQISRGVERRRYEIMGYMGVVIQGLILGIIKIIV